MPTQSGQDHGRDEEEEGLVNSTTPELEDGERRPSLAGLPTDLPLNLSAAAAAAASHPTLRVLGAELLQHPDKIPTSVASLYHGGMLGPFGLPPFPFPFPTSTRPPISTAGSTPPVTAGGRIQIFNPEAYCELCNKEFCNKYFLKTHKANKHGIYSEGVPLSGSPPTSSSPSNNGAHQGSEEGRPLPPTSQSSQGPPTPNSQAGSPFSGAFIAANMGALRPPFVPLSPGASPSPKGGPPGSLMSPRSGDNSIPDFRQTMEERERLMQRDASGLLPKENGELRKSLESPQRAPSTPGAPPLSGPPVPPPNIPGLPAHMQGFNPLMFGGLPNLEALRKEASDSLKEGGVKRPLIPNIPNVPNVSAPNSIGGSAGPTPKGPFTPEKLRQMGVINADAFCEICCKEFCNKYFLRVHKLKKHGICSPDLPPEKVQKILNQMAKEAGKTGNPPPPIVRPPMSAASPFGSPGSPDKMRGLPMGPAGLQLRPPGLMSLPPLEPLLPQALKDFKNHMPPPNFDNGPFRHHPKEQEIIRINDDVEEGQQHLPDEESSRDKSENDRNGSEAEEEQGMTRPSEDLQRLQSMIMELNSNKAKGLPGASAEASETICKVCNKDMENKYFLRAHMMNEHGVLNAEEPLPEGKEQPEAPRLPPPPVSLLNGLDISNAQDFAAKFLQQMQKGFPVLDGDDRGFLERVKSELAAASNNINGPGGPPGIGGPLGSPGGPNSPHKKVDKDPNRKPASLSRSYCDICKKELCNKYFMKTHMLKMHGINIEANNSAGVNCHICKKELCSKYFLKVHMQNSHGLMEDGSPIPPHLKENGSGLFPGMFPPLGPPPHELLGGPPGSGSPIGPGGPGGPGGDKEHYFSRLLNEQSEMSKEKLERQRKEGNGAASAGGSHTCSLCGEGFPEMVALQVHIIKIHGAFPPDSSLFGNLEASKIPGGPGSEAGKESPSGSNGEDRRMDDGKSEGEVTPNKAPSTPALQMPGGLPLPISSSSMSTPPSSSAGAGEPISSLNKQFPHIEMLQRHMLSQQFPGLINPLLSGFPGFPGGPPPLAFTNPLQQLLAGQKAGCPPSQETSVTSKTEEDSNLSKAMTSSGKLITKKRRFKCSKCQLKFKKREDCLVHIHAQHSVSSNASVLTSRRKLQFSPNKGHQLRKNHRVRSQYVKTFMEMLRVPTSRGTPSKATNHIMQAFLIKKDTTEMESEMNANNNSSDFVPSMVYLPVAKKINEPLTVAFSLTPA
eukprot:15045.XXX_642018_645962_1 [CDS] Oithona nana genome sequencing.